MFELNYRSHTPIYRQLEERIMEMVVLGAYQKDDRLPSVRSLAEELGVNPNTIQKAYQELESMGVVYSVGGKGSFIQGISSAQEHMRKRAGEKLSEAARGARLTGMERSEALVIVERAFDAGQPMQDSEREVNQNDKNG